MLLLLHSPIHDQWPMDLFRLTSALLHFAIAHVTRTDKPTSRLYVVSGFTWLAF
jgi:hypothetical protein